MNDICNSESDKTNAIIDINCRFLSECTMPDDTRILSREIASESKLESNTNYGNICKSWKFNNIPLHSQSHLSFKLIMAEDVAYMRKQRDRKSIFLFLGKNLSFD